MNRIKAIFFFTVTTIVVVLSSCSRNLDLPDTNAQAKIVLIGELVAGSPIYLRAGKSLPIASGSTMRFELARDLTLTYNDGSGSIAIPGFEDSLSSQNHTIPFSVAQVAESGKTYTVTASHVSMMQASAIVYIPGPVIAAVLDTASVDYNSGSALRIKVQINNTGSTGNFYVIESIKQKTTVYDSFYYSGKWLSVTGNGALYAEVKASGTVVEKHDTIFHNEFYRRKIFSDDKNNENAYEGGVSVAHNRILLKGEKFPGTVYSTEVYVQKSPHLDSLSGNSFLYIKSVAPDYFNFLKNYEQYGESSSFNNFSDPVKLTGNVSNGEGMIGGVAQARFRIP